MSTKDKELLIKDLSARLPYGVIVHLKYDENTSITREMGLGSLHDIMFDSAAGKPYLRPMSSMTEKEKEDYHKTMDKYTHRIYPNSADFSEHTEYSWTAETIDWLNTHHFDYRGLIERDLAIKVTENNNPYKD